MNNTNSKEDSIPLSGGTAVRIRTRERLMLPAPCMSAAPKGSLFSQVTGIAARGILLLCLLIVTGAFAAGVSPSLAESVSQLVQQENIEKAAELKHRREEILWFARAIYSESEFTSEQRYVAWAIRSRVESGKYPGTYEGVVLQPHQFSGLNHYDQWYDVNISRDYGVGDTVWESALRVAEEVYDASSSERLLPEGTTHFYSPVAVRKTPEWAIGREPVETLSGRLGTRFAFYNNVN